MKIGERWLPPLCRLPVTAVGDRRVAADSLGDFTLDLEVAVGANGGKSTAVEHCMPPGC